MPNRAATVAVATPCCREHRLADAVIDLVCARVVEILTLEIDLRAAELVRPTLRVIDWAWATNIMLELALELGDELGIALVTSVFLTQLIERADQRLGNEDAAIGSEMAARIGQVIHLHCELPW